MAICAYLNFNGNCREAVEFYAEAFGIDNPQIMAFGDAPSDPSYALPEEAKNLVMHARLDVLGGTIMFSDVFPGMAFTQGNNISLTLISTDIDEIKRLFQRLSEGGKVGMELQETFWSKCYGMATDKFGIEWQFSFDNGDFAV